jgi:hypothetical protein
MDNTKIKLSGIWATVMFTYLLGDVLRIYSGAVVLGEIGGVPMSQGVYLGIAAFMVIPAVMVALSLILNHSVNRWANIIIAFLFFILNGASLLTYSPFDIFLLVVSMIFNILTVRYAWQWHSQGA